MVLVTLTYCCALHFIHYYNWYLFHAASVKADFKDSRDHCSGNVKILYGGQRYPVCKESLINSDVRNTICKELQCGDTGDTLEFFGPRLPLRKTVSLNCPANINKLAECYITLQNEGHCSLGGLQCSGKSKMFWSNWFMHCRGTCTMCHITVTVR